MAGRDSMRYQLPLLTITVPPKEGRNGNLGRSKKRMEPLTLKDLEAMNYRDLQVLAKNRSLKATGKRADLEQRLLSTADSQVRSRYCLYPVVRSRNPTVKTIHTDCILPYYYVYTQKYNCPRSVLLSEVRTSTD